MPHIHEKIDFTASVFVVNRDAVLLRMHEKYHKWLSVGGHVELDEDPEEAAVREAKEEAGVDIRLAGELPDCPSEEKGGEGFKNLRSPRYMNIHKVTPDSEHKHCDFIYFATCDSRTTGAGSGAGEHEKSAEMRWFTREEIDDPSFAMYPSTRFYAKAALDELGS